MRERESPNHGADLLAPGRYFFLPFLFGDFGWFAELILATSSVQKGERG